MWESKQDDIDADCVHSLATSRAGREMAASDVSIEMWSACYND